MNFKKKLLAGLTVLAGVVGSLMAQETRTLTLIEDYDQKYMCTRVFELKYIQAQDLTPFVLGAVKRYNPESDVQRLNYKYGKKTYLVVSTGVDMMPYVIDMVAKLDRPCDKKDEAGSIVDGDGIYRFVYYTKFRATENMNAVLQNTVSDGKSFVDTSVNMFYWKDSLSDGTTYLKYLKALDRPVPQLNIQLNVYEINENDFTELGVDYISWKNGPGADLLGIGYDWLNFTSVQDFSQWTNSLNAVAKGPASDFTGMGGFMVAPNFDATFLRMLAQKGKAKVATSGQLVVINDFDSDPGNDNFASAKYRLRFTPNYQTIQKDDDRNISIDSLQEEFYFYLRNPTIGFNDAATEAATLMFGWVLNISDQVEQTNTGAPVINQQLMRSWLTLEAGTEKLLTTYTKEHMVKQYNGMPFLGDIPVLKYIFGAAANSKTKTRVFITVKSSPVVPDTSVSEWAGKVITAAELVKEDLKNIDQ
jgi:hypothetical protein